jgi:hypothetical protein
VHGSTGELVLANHSLSISRGDKTQHLMTQLDYDVGYNAAPDYTGAGFSREHANFLAAVRGEAGGDPMTVEETAELERLIFDLYGMAGTEPLGGSTGPADARFDAIVHSLIKTGSGRIAAAAPTPSQERRA